MGSSLIPSISAMKVLCLLALLVTLLSVKAAPQGPGPMARDAPVSEDRGLFFLGALARARCRSTCAAVAYAATTSCTALFVTAPCNVMFPVSAAAAAGR